MKRRQMLIAAGTVSTVGLAGCLGGDEDDEESSNTQTDETEPDNDSGLNLLNQEDIPASGWEQEDAPGLREEILDHGFDEFRFFSHDLADLWSATAEFSSESEAISFFEGEEGIDESWFSIGDQSGARDGHEPAGMVRISNQVGMVVLHPHTGSREEWEETSPFDMSDTDVVEELLESMTEP